MNKLAKVTLGLGIIASIILISAVCYCVGNTTGWHEGYDYGIWMEQNFPEPTRLPEPV